METHRISFQSFKDMFLRLGCFSDEQVLLWKDDFSRFNLSRWVKEGRIIRLRQNLYTFPEILTRSEHLLFFSGRMYSPSYISLHYALHYYEIIPEEVVQITAISTKKTKEFDTPYGCFSYHNVKPQLMFGFELRECMAVPGYRVPFALPEKAVLDLLYLYPEYNTEESIRQLRFDEDFMSDDFDWARFEGFSDRVSSPALKQRVDLVREVYHG